MTKLEHFKQWASTRYRIRQDGGTIEDSAVFDNPNLHMAWLAFQHAFTIRPTTDSRLNSAEFMKDNPATIVDRLNGIFPTADPPYKMTPLHYEAAREIERLRSEYASRGTDDELVNAVMLAQTDKLALEAEIERLRGELAKPKELNGKFYLVGFRSKDKGAADDYWAYFPMRFFKVEQAPDTDVDLLYVNTEQE